MYKYDDKDHKFAWGTLISHYHAKLKLVGCI